MRRSYLFRFIALFLLAGAVFTASRPFFVRATEEGIFTHAKTEERIVALTFDDGPHPRYTQAILDLLGEYGAKATFFVIGKNLEYYGDAAKRAVREGHEIGNHTYSHPTLPSLSRKALEEELLRNEEVIEEVLGVLPTVFRPPEGSCTAAVVEVAKKHGSPLVLWSIDTRDWAGVNTKKIVSEVLGKVRPGSIILFHDYTVGNCHTVDALKEILPQLCAAGYRFVTVSELLRYEREE